VSCRRVEMKGMSAVQLIVEVTQYQKQNVMPHIQDTVQLWHYIFINSVQVTLMLKLPLKVS